MKNLLTMGALLGLAAVSAGCNRQSGYETCTPGVTYLAGCSGTVGASCTGDPTLSVCEDSVTPEACESTTPRPPLLAFDDDSGPGLCPETMFVCPASGRVAINPEPFSSSSYTCAWDIQPR